ncbi:MAG TPA: hypothetical protein VF911_18475 [Thermoanaerobaculia bacterium]
MPAYEDLFVRDDLADTGQIPSKAATASYSPDVLVWGTDTIPDPQKYLSDNYDKTWYKNVVYGEQNYIYCRAKNLFPGSQTGQLYLRYANSGLFCNVDSWRNNLIGTAIPDQNYLNLAAQRNQIVCGDSAFLWNPPNPPNGAHYCLIAQIVTEEHPNPLPDRFNSFEEYVQWVVDNPAISWRNVQIVDAASPPQYQENFYIENVEQNEVEVLVTTTGFNLPADTSLSMVCGAVGPEPPIDRSTITAGGTRPAQVAQSSYLPPAFAGWVTATVHLPPGQSWEPGMSVLVEAYVISRASDSESFRSLAVPLSSVLLDPSTATASATTAVRLGRYTVQTKTEESLQTRTG